jgi:pectate lyase
MKKRLSIFSFPRSFAFLVFTSASANIAAIPAFPSAEGYGTQTTGGRGGTICEVTNLNDTGLGSLRDCVEMQAGARTVVFRVGGTISLSRDIVINAAHSYLTIAGQTAVGGGVQLKNWGFVIQDGGHDIVIRYLRVRPGSNACIAQGGGSCDSVNAFTLLGRAIEKRVYNVVLDHISAQWGVDQNMNVWNSVSDVTIQNSIIAEGATKGHSKGSHSMGFLVGGDIVIDTTHPRTLSIHHSLFAHNEDRNPRVDDPTIFDFRNNVIYYSNIAANFKMEYPVSSYPTIFNLSST